MKAIVIGAGIGGLSAAVALKQSGIDCDVYEAVKEIKPVGAAISVWPNGVKCMAHLGMGDIMETFGGPLRRMAYRDFRSGENMTQFSLAPLIERTGSRPCPVSRAELQREMLDFWGRESVQFGKRVTRCEEDADGVTVWFTDGSSASGDLLIAADGSHSALRPWVLGFTPQRRYAGYVNWNGLVEIDEALAPGDQWTTFVGEGKRVSLMPVSAGRFYFFFDVPLPAGLAEDRDTLRADLSRYFAGWAPPVQQLIATLDPQTTNRIEIHDIEPFSRLVRGRVALLGDAGHSTTPDIGQGGCAAMEDAVVLGAVFRQTHDIAAALREYEAQRCDRVRDLVLKARKRCDITHGKDMQLTEAWYQELREETGERIINGMCDTILSGPRKLTRGRGTQRQGQRSQQRTAQRDKGQLSALDLVQHVEQAEERHAAAAQHQRLDEPDIIAADGILRRKVMVAIEERHPLMDDQRRAGHDMPLQAELAQRQRFRPRQGMVRTHHNPHFQFGKGQHAESGLPLRIEDQADVQVRLTHFLADGAAVGHLQIQLQPRPAGDDLRQRGGEAPFRQRLHHPNADASALHPLQLIKFLSGLAKLLLPAQQIVIQQFTGGGHPQSLRQALEQRGAEGLLGLQDLAVNCRGGDMQLLGGPAQAAAAGHGDKIVGETGKRTHGTPVLFFATAE